MNAQLKGFSQRFPVMEIEPRSKKPWALKFLSIYAQVESRVDPYLST